MKPKEFFNRWRKGMMELTPKQMLKSKQAGQIGTIFGVGFGGSYMVFINKAWWWSLLFSCIIFLQVLDFISTRKQLKQIIEFEEVMKEDV